MTKGRHLALLVRYFGDYELIRELGRGGMGDRLQGPPDQPQPPGGAQDDPVGRAGLATTSCGGSRTRPRRSPLLDHPHIVPILEVGEHDGQRYFTMKLIGGLEPGQEAGRLHRRSEGGRAAGGDGRRGGAPRPPAGHPAPRPQAGQHPARRARRAARHRLRPGQAGRGRQRADSQRRDHGHAGLHGAGAGVGPARGGDDGERRLRPGGGALCPA